MRRKVPTRQFPLVVTLMVVIAACGERVVGEEKLKLGSGDHICYIGNTLADRMQHHGWLETRIQARFPNLELVFRNLGFSADELTVRPRSANFGDPDSHLRHSKADVVFAFFGYNESFAGEAGLGKLRSDLAGFIDHTLLQQYNGQSAPRLVLFSPIAHEDLGDANLPDGAENNRRLQMYTTVIAEVAAEKGVPFVDLFAPTAAMYAQTSEPLTVNGIHLTLEGNRQLANVIDQALFGDASDHDVASLERLRQAILDKNLHWFNRYRTTDGYNVYGGRSQLRFVDGQTNYDVMQREMQILDVMTANRDRRVWAIARGGDLTVNDNNTPPSLLVKTNRPGRTADGKHLFLGGEEATKRMSVAEGMDINLFASEETFPELVNPVQSAVDTNGRLWVAAWPTYPHWNPHQELNDKLLILPDDDGDGRADRCIVFADGLHNPTGFEFWGGGVLLAQAPDLMFLKDTDGDDRADVRIRVLHGIDSADTHHTANAFVIGPDGGLYFQRGVFHVTNIESPWGPAFRSGSTGMYRFDPRSRITTMHFGMGPNPHGDVFDRWGYQFASDGTSGTGFYIGFPDHGTPKQLYQKRVRPVPAIGLLSSEHFPEGIRGNLLICNVIGFQGVMQYQFVDEGAGFHAEEIEPIVVSSDANFRPSDLEIGGDGALYVLDWHNPLIGHMQHNIRDPSRDHSHGRVYRVTARGRPLLKPARMAGRPIDEVIKHLESPSDSVRYRARLELSGRDSREVASAVSQWAANLDPLDIDDAQQLVEALWLHQQHKIVDAELLKQVLRSPEPHARAAATRVLQEWGNKIPDAGPLLVAMAADEHPRVRHEAVVAASFYDGVEAAEVLFEAEQLPQDQQLTFSLNEARRGINLDAYIKQAIADGRKLSPPAERYMLRNASVADLLNLERTEAVYRAILDRTNAAPSQLSDALVGLAELKKAESLDLLLNLIEAMDAKEQAGSIRSLGQVLARQPREKLAAAGDRIRQLAATGKLVETRRAGYAAWIAADGSADDAFLAAAAQRDSLRDLLEAIPLVANDEIRGRLYPRVKPLLFELPNGLATGAPSPSLELAGIAVDFFQPNPANVAIETLAKLEPAASGVVPEITMDVPQLKTRDQFALRFTGSIGLDKSGTYTFYLASDDGSRLYIGDELVVNHDGLHGMSEKSGSIELQAGSHPIVVTYFDNGGGDGLNVAWAGPGFEKQPIPVNRLTVSGGETLQDVAIRALTAIPGHEVDKFHDLTSLIRVGAHRTASIRAIRQIPSSQWPKNQLRPLADNLVAYLSDIPAKYRTSPTAADAIGLARQLASLLPPNQAKDVDDRLANLDVRVIAIGTVPHRMIYDKERIIVQAGKPVEFRFSNADSMPHNFAITQPGALVETGLLAEATGNDPAAMERHYIPKTDKILLSSRLLQPGESQTLSFEVPATAGVYPYVCTYPGHWRRMYGAMYVVDDLAAYRADPAGYLESYPATLQDEPLKHLGQEREWKVDELAGEFQPLPGGRSFEVGKQLFSVTNCVACHRLNDEGQQIGQDLSKLDAKLTPVDILRSIVEPSHKIDDKFVSYVFLLDSGKIVTGMILEETDDEVKVIENPLAKTKARVIAKDEIEEQRRSPKSIMPEGLLNKLTRDDIVDLVAYVYARGDKNHKLFHAHHHAP